MITISLCMIVKNEEDTIERCLVSAGSVADEIIIVDTGSGDRTKEIASRFTDKIYNFDWIDDFSVARNYSYKQATMDYILWLDADDMLLPKDAVKFKELKEILTHDIDIVMMRYNTDFDAQGNVVFSYFRERLSKRSRNFQWREPVHEYLEAKKGERINSDICITHTKSLGRLNNRNIQIYEKFLSQGKELSPRGRYYYARELKDHERYTDAIKQFRFFLDSELGWVEDNIVACGELAKCYLAENKSDKALSSMLRSFCYDTPRAELCCQIGYYFKERGNYRQAIFWFEIIFNLEKDDNNWGFSKDECWGYIPSIELAMCYDKLGEYGRAAKFNEMALKFKPDSLVAFYNKKYLENRLVNHNI